MIINNINIPQINIDIDNFYINPYKFNSIKNNEYTTTNSDLNEIIKTLTSIILSNSNSNSNSNNYIEISDYINVNNTFDSTLFKLIANNNIKEIEKLIKNNKNINFNVQDNDGDTPLHISIFLSNLNICEILLSNNVDIFIKDKWGQIALHRICFCLNNSNTLNIIKLFENFSKKINKTNVFNVVDKFNNTPFHLILKYLIKNNVTLTNNHIKIINKLKLLTNCKIINNDNMSINNLLKLLNIE